MKNKYAGTCPKCKRHVPAGEGEANLVGTRWVVRHINDDHCRHALMTKATVPVQRAQPRSTYARDYYEDPESEPYYGMAQHEFDPDIGDR